MATYVVSNERILISGLNVECLLVGIQVQVQVPANLEVIFPGNFLIFT